MGAEPAENFFLRLKQEERRRGIVPSTLVLSQLLQKVLTPPFLSLSRSRPAECFCRGEGETFPTSAILDSDGDEEGRSNGALLWAQLPKVTLLSKHGSPLAEAWYIDCDPKGQQTPPCRCLSRVQRFEGSNHLERLPDEAIHESAEVNNVGR